MEEDTTSTVESLARGRSIGAFRCLNCFERVSPPVGTKTYKCPHCSFEWRVFWVSPDIPRIRGPVWEVNRRLAGEAKNKQKRTRTK